MKYTEYKVGDTVYLPKNYDWKKAGEREDWAAIDKLPVDTALIVDRIKSYWLIFKEGDSQLAHSPNKFVKQLNVDYELY